MSELTAALDGLVAGYEPIGLDELQATADLQSRVDRKYVVDIDDVKRLISMLGPGLQVFEIAGARCQRYESMYFDTPELMTYFDAAHDHRRRFKVRTRVYVETMFCILELKVRGYRKMTVKERIPYPIEDRYRLNEDARAFMNEQLWLPVDQLRLEPTFETSYRRCTILSPDRATRLTIDSELKLQRPDGRVATLPEHYVVETKSDGAPTLADRILWSGGRRPFPFSKYCMAVALLGHERANAFRPALRAIEGGL